MPTPRKRHNELETTRNNHFLLLRRPTPLRKPQVASTVWGHGTCGLTSIVRDAELLNTALNVGKGRESSNSPAVSNATLDDLGTAHALHKRGVLEDLVNPLDSLGNSGARRRRIADLEGFSTEIIQAVSLFHLEVPVLYTVYTVSAMSSENVKLLRKPQQLRLGGAFRFGNYDWQTARVHPNFETGVRQCSTQPARRRHCQAEVVGTPLVFH